MKTTTTRIENPSQKLLTIVRKIKEEKEATQKDIRANWEKFFPKK